MGNLRNPRRQRQRGRHQPKCLMSKTMAVYAHYDSWYISLPSSTNSALSAEREPQRLIFRISIWN